MSVAHRGGFVRLRGAWTGKKSHGCRPRASRSPAAATTSTRSTSSSSSWTDAADDIGQVAVIRKLELVGKSTAHILLTTEQESQELKRQTAEDCAALRAEAEADAQEVREARRRVRHGDPPPRPTTTAATHANKQQPRPTRHCRRVWTAAAKSTAGSTSWTRTAPARSMSSTACAPTSARHDRCAPDRNDDERRARPQRPWRRVHRGGLTDRETAR
jgi:hypothetical protein